MFLSLNLYHFAFNRVRNFLIDDSLVNKKIVYETWYNTVFITEFFISLQTKCSTNITFFNGKTVLNSIFPKSPTQIER
jgi:hypothetical protein